MHPVLFSEVHGRGTDETAEALNSLPAVSFVVHVPVGVIVCDSFAMSNSCDTGGAASTLEPSPGCVAVIVQWPAPSIVTVSPAIEHVPFAANVTASLELALALTVNGASP